MPFFKIMDENNNHENLNKTPHKMSRLAWPKAKYGVVLAIIIIIVVNFIYYKDFFLSLFK
ncbi:MAG: hypothetical protein CML72_02705 [Rhodobacterales bacterium]|nr:hypothetical protein [Rhodobacterales bacterium]